MRPRPPLLLTQLNWNRSAPPSRLPDGVAHELRQRQRQHDGQIQPRAQQDAAPLRSVLDEAAEQVAAGKQRERQKRVRMHQRQRGGPERQQRRLPIGFLPDGGNQQIQRRNPHRPAAQQRALGEHQIRDDV